MQLGDISCEADGGSDATVEDLVPAVIAVPELINDLCFSGFFAQLR